VSRRRPPPGIVVVMNEPRTPSAALANISLEEDWHVHSTFSDGVSSMQENVRAAEVAGLSTLCLVDHVRSDTPWVPEFVAEARRVALGTDVRVLCGLEAKMLDTRGDLDLPADHALADRLLIADHQLPSAGGPMDPTDVRDLIAAGDLTGDQVVEWLLLSYERALERHQGAILAHPFSLLPKMGLEPRRLRREGVSKLALVARENGASIEISERWRCPEPWVVKEFVLAGVRVIVSTDSHRADTIGRYGYCREVLEGLRDPLRHVLKASPA